MKTFTAEQLTILAKFKAESYDDYLDDIHTTEKNEFEENVFAFINWVDSLSQNEIIEILNV
jgi:hypothetical protein